VCVSLSLSLSLAVSLAPAQRGRAAAGQLCEPERGVVLVGVEGDERADGAERGKAVGISHETVERVICSERSLLGLTPPFFLPEWANPTRAIGFNPRLTQYPPPP